MSERGKSGIGEMSPLLQKPAPTLPLTIRFFLASHLGRDDAAANSFYLKAHDFRGKTIRPFITHGGFGVGDSLSILNSHAPGARIELPFVMEADQERRTLNEVKGWLAEIEKS